ncbi:MULTISPECIES: 5'-deoxynucleotidase [Methylococcus]|uniref:5'-deoxynucleotidase n=1 Tax=Methylococcus capsulatus TaxID=414 RepID=A0ABZ2F1X3_METCP|nr:MULTISPECIES: 5'-deoxynucleotidase [Methylococcus]MDF9391377.1 5'-deoxynucleotidase [Methylococcus capsulatus]
MNQSPFFAHLGRLRWIKRWGLMRNAYEENVMEHGWEVAVIAHALAVIRGEIFRRPVDADRVAAAALYHDVSEAITGDLPTPIKYHSPAIRDAYKDLEQKASRELLALLPEALQSAYARMLLPDEIPEEVQVLIKAADRIAAYLKCCAERRAGNTEFVNAEEEIREKIRQLGLPEVDYFMAVFVPGYELTLDRLVL